MFQFTTTTIVNSLYDYNDPNKALITEVKEGNTVKGIHIKRDFKFLADNVEAIYKRAASDPVMAQATIDLTEVDIVIPPWNVLFLNLVFSFLNPFPLVTINLSLAALPKSSPVCFK